ncbi:MAG: flagellar biosynthetic protein FliO [Pirellulales bacterium]|nr:flagellar biosynthetic protein FliO [Pirellulales bacterium]
MPPGVRNVIAILVLLGPAELAAQTFPPQFDPPSVPTAAPQTDRFWASPIAGAAPITDANTDRVVSASFASPVADRAAPGAGELNASSSSVRAAHEVALPASGRPEFPRLSPPSRAARKDRLSDSRGGIWPSLLTIGSSLAVVLGLFFLFAWTMRRASPRGTVALPTDVVEVLGRTTLTHRQHLHLLRCGRKLLLISVCLDSVEPLTEITEPEEVDRLSGLCRQSHPQSVSAAFQQVFHQFARERTDPALARSADEALRPAGTGLQRLAYRGREDADA